MAYNVVYRSEELRTILEGRDRRVSPVLAKQLRGTIEKLRNDPTRVAHAERLKHNYAGLWSVRVTGRVRLLYKLCADCLQDPRFRQKHPLPCCRGEELAESSRVNLLRLLDYHR
jgi:Txe/YoeB family toxin of Txe-Axe toxin-antitoxin module